MDCSPILALLALCTPTPEGPPTALSLTSERPAATSCMSKEQARAAYKTSHLYWHGARHCWDASATSARRHERPVAPSRESNPHTVSDASGNVAPLSAARIEIYYPALLRAQAEITTDLYAVQRPITDWPLMLDIDVTGPDPDNGIDGCCWPPMETLR